MTAVRPGRVVLFGRAAPPSSAAFDSQILTRFRLFDQAPIRLFDQAPIGLFDQAPIRLFDQAPIRLFDQAPIRTHPF